MAQCWPSHSRADMIVLKLFPTNEAVLYIVISCNIFKYQLYYNCKELLQFGLENLIICFLQNLMFGSF